jgi:hypothetical protein
MGQYCFSLTPNNLAVVVGNAKAQDGFSCEWTKPIAVTERPRFVARIA